MEDAKRAIGFLVEEEMARGEGAAGRRKAVAQDTRRRRSPIWPDPCHMMLSSQSATCARKHKNVQEYARACGC